MTLALDEYTGIYLHNGKIDMYLHQFETGGFGHHGFL